MWHNLNYISIESAFWLYFHWKCLLNISLETQPCDEFRSKWNEANLLKLWPITRHGQDVIILTGTAVLECKYNMGNKSADLAAVFWIGILECLIRWYDASQELSLCFNLILVWYWSAVAISFWVGSLTRGKSYDFSIVTKMSIQNDGQIIRWGLLKTKPILWPTCLLDRWMACHTIHAE